jgi:methylenetetrahydrofolate dehydrogenase (NADP+) / methenyltetrahydrofolate cyclohydrolase
MKLLNGSELVGYIKERQAKQVRSLRQSWKVSPKLAILRTGSSHVTDKYMHLKANYGEDILIDVDTYDLDDDEIIDKIKQLNSDKNVHGIIIQLPLANRDMTNEVINAVSPDKDIDGLGDNSKYIPATAMAIDWLLTGYGVDLEYKKIAIVGKGRLVGMPLAKLWINNGLDVSICDTKTTDLVAALHPADVIVTATGVPQLITSDMIKEGAVVVDAGTASKNNKIVGDLADAVRERDDLTITPLRGGVGPMTVAALFDNVITAARKIADKKGQQDVK